METELPGAATLIEAARQAMREVPDDPLDRERTTARRRRAASSALDQWVPVVDEITDLAGAAVFLGARLDTLKRRRWRARADGTPDWPRPDIEVGRTAGWKYRTIVLHQAEAPGRGHHGQATAPIPGDAVVYLAVSDLADHFGVAANTVHSWRTRYRPGRGLEETAKAPNCPQPDVIVGMHHPQAGWRQDRLQEWDAWHASLPGQGAGSGRPRTGDPGVR
jgi:hypothetical protein